MTGTWLGGQQSEPKEATLDHAQLSELLAEAKKTRSTRIELTVAEVEDLLGEFACPAPIGVEQ